MLIDTHIHTKRCHHAEGDLEDYIIAAIQRGLKIICFTEHAPLHFDLDKRLSQDESKKYIDDLEELKNKYNDKIEILIGFEIDYIEEYEEKIKDFIEKTNVDFYLGSIHFIPFEKKLFSVWDYEDIYSNPELQNEYFRLMLKAIRSDLFDSISHPDLIYRSGFKEDCFKDKFKEIARELKMRGTCYEINCSNMFKTKFNPKENKMEKISFLNMNNIDLVSKQSVLFTIGSDSHKIDELGRGMEELLKVAKEKGYKIVYFKNREKQEVKV